MTKSQTTMYGLAFSEAMGIGPRIHNRRAGFFLTVDELRSLYSRMGFNVANGRTVIERHVTSWMCGDKAASEGSMQRLDSVVWFPCPREEETAVKILAEKCGGRCFLDVTREWPSIAVLHGIQETIEEADA